ncbi:hypothetical protein IW261DRAFT_1551841 [Armillaria novae-zelandiae]|uniref:Uncharacterized protein n=1 Tax=Armillaria novae-zelandiae TaxID=153914 RepID=A0AA39P5A5_9AGAR|nr:hypothetical protein IW261DRAFT_1551841 [Armillaria novae-zelandiae]
MQSVIPPTACLPPIKKITCQSPQDLSQCLLYILRGSKRRRPDCKTDLVLDASYKWRSDSFERLYAIRWLTALVSQVKFLEEELKSNALITQAATLLAICSGTAGAGIIRRDFVFPPGTIEVRLTDVPLENQDFGSVGAQTWGGACVLAEAIEYVFWNWAPGTGLVSITIGKLLEENVTIVTTDFYPSVVDNLRANIEHNFAQPHAVWIKACLQKFLRKGAIFHLVIPL